jgi:Ca2+-binding RTX toxin-like protein
MAVINGTLGNDVLNGTEFDDTINGFDGADDLFGNDGNDSLIGGPGAVLLGGFNDLLDGGAGNDTLFAGDGPDSLVGGDGNDNLFGEAGADTARGGFGNDNLFGGSENDTLFGDDGDDFLEGGTGADSLVGGAGIDTAFYSFAVSAFLGNPAANTGDAAGDTYDGIENLTSAGFNDVLGGDGGANRLTANAGNDTLVASGGNDTLDGGTGRDTADYSAIAGTTTLRAVGIVEKGGGLGTDQILGIERIVANAAFSNTIDAFVGPGQTTRLVADLSANFLLITGIPFLGSATFTVENFFNVRGTFNDDIVIGSDTAANRFFGTAGDDFYDGRADFDAVDYTSLGAQVTLLAEGAIVKDGGALGTDLISNMESIEAAFGFRNLIDGQIAGPQTTSFFVNLESNLLQVIGIPGIGFASFNVTNFVDVRGTRNADTIIGASFFDNTFFASLGNDAYDGLGGFDSVDYAGIGTGIALRSQGVIDKGPAGVDQIFNMERIVGDAGFRNLIDGFVAGPQATSFDINLLAGTVSILNVPGLGTIGFTVENFEDVRGTANSDTITGNDGDNLFFGSAGFDRHDGAGDFDTIDYTGIGGPVRLLSQGVIEKGALGTDQIFNMERIVGEAGLANLIDGTVAGPQSTSFTVDLAADALTVSGVPVIGSIGFVVENFRDVRGTANGDTVGGDAAGNTFFGSAGGDTYDGREGVDTIEYTGVGGAVTLLSQGVIDKGVLGSDQILNMERIIGAAGFTNRIDGRVADPLAQTTSFNVHLGLNSLVINGIPGIGSASFEVFSFANVNGTNNADVIVGDALVNGLFGEGGNDTVRGGDGNDSLGGGEGADLLDGGAGIDTAGYGGATASIIANLAAPAGNTNIAAGDTYIGVENLSGSSFDDRLTGDSGANQLSGQIGNDTLIGALGADTLIGVAGDDSAQGDGGNDSLNGGGGNDTLAGSVGNDTLVGDAGNDTLDGGDGIDNLNGGAGADAFRGGIGNDTIVGDVGNDTINGGAGADRLTGGLNSDIFVFLANTEGSDTITDFNPAAGQDIFQISRAGFGNVLPVGALPAANFASNLTGTATAAAPQILYDTDAGTLFFDLDGTGAVARAQLATLQGLPVLTVANFTVIA